MKLVLEDFDRMNGYQDDFIFVILYILFWLRRRCTQISLIPSALIFGICISINRLRQEVGYVWHRWTD